MSLRLKAACLQCLAWALMLASKGPRATNRFGPNMRLARELLLAGEREAVLEYFRRCAGFWKRGASRLEGWRSAVEAGKMPDFGPNLIYGTE
ncbi:MAG: hypothetical protein HY721_16950 [Planctomycetes bacterium]|nr:hypothetical protein [Planctomycetota bacterium]